MVSVQFKPLSVLNTCPRTVGINVEIKINKTRNQQIAMPRSIPHAGLLATFDSRVMRFL